MSQQLQQRRQLFCKPKLKKRRTRTGRKKIKNAGKIRRNFRLSVNVLTFWHVNWVKTFCWKLLNHVPPNFPGSIKKISYIEVVIKAVKTLDKFLKITEDYFLNSLWTASNQTGHLSYKSRFHKVFFMRQPWTSSMPRNFWNVLNLKWAIFMYKVHTAL